MRKRIFLNVLCLLLIIFSVIGIYFTVDDAKKNEMKSDNNVSVNDFAPNTEVPKLPEENTDKIEQYPKENRHPNDMNWQQKPAGQSFNNKRLDNNYYSNYVRFSTIQVVMLIIYTLVISASILLLINTRLFKKGIKESFINKDKIIIFILSMFLMSGVLSFVIDSYVTNNIKLTVLEENKEITGDDIDSGEMIKGKEINLDDYDTNVTITEAGVYTLKGTLNNSVLVDADGKVTLNLAGVNITSNNTAAIANRTTNDLIINLVDGTVNYLTDNGNSEYDGGLFSNGHLYIEGSGTLNVYGKQVEGEGISTTDNDITINGGIIYIESNDDGINAGGDIGGTVTINDGMVQIKASGDGIDSNDNINLNGEIVYAVGSATGGDAGIDADNGYEINGGLIIALGSDMLESPSKNSKQNIICFDLDEVIKEDELITLLNSNGDVIVSFEAIENFRTLIISSDELNIDSYTLYQGGTNKGVLNNNIYANSNYSNGKKIIINNIDIFEVNSNITVIK